MITAILTGISLAMDAFAISITNGMTMKGFRTRHAAIMAAYFGLFQFFMPLIGSVLAGAVSAYISRFGPYISFAVLAFIGVRMILDALKPDEDGGGSSAGADGRLDHKRLLALAVATSIDALAVGVAMGLDPMYLGGMGLVPACAVIGVVTFLICLAGCWLGKSVVGAFSGRRAAVVGGLVLVGIGVKLLLEGVGLI